MLAIKLDSYTSDIWKNIISVWCPADICHVYRRNVEVYVKHHRLDRNSLRSEGKFVL